MRKCNKDCNILKVLHDKKCPILEFPTNRFKTNWFFSIGDIQYYPLCESGSTIEKKSKKECVIF